MSGARRPLPSPLQLLVVAVGAAAGATLRWGLGVAFPTPDFPWTTLAINVSGAFALGVLPVVVRRSHAAALALGPGLLGGFTTVSTWALQVRDLAADDRAGLAGLYLGVTLAAGLTAAHLGRLLAHRPEPEDALT